MRNTQYLWINLIDVGFTLTHRFTDAGGCDLLDRLSRPLLLQFYSLRCRLGAGFLNRPLIIHRSSRLEFGDFIWIGVAEFVGFGGYLIDELLAVFLPCLVCLVRCVRPLPQALDFLLHLVVLTQ